MNQPSRTALILSCLIMDVMGEGVYSDRVGMISKEAILNTAYQIDEDIYNGLLVEDRGSFWYSGIVDDYGGYFEVEYEAMPKQITA